jgi:hypothetical protein
MDKKTEDLLRQFFKNEIEYMKRIGEKKYRSSIRKTLRKIHKKWFLDNPIGIPFKERNKCLRKKPSK